MYLKGCNIFEHDLMLFPVHKPQHWSLVVSCRTMSRLNCYYYNIQVVYPKLKFILCIDSLHFSNVDEVNCIWLDIIILYMLCMGTPLTHIY